MNIADIIPRIQSNPNDFPRFWAMFMSEAIKIKNQWEFLAGKRAEVRVKDGGLGWWGKQYLSNGQIVVKRNQLGFQIYYEPVSTKDYEKIIEDGRPAYNLVANLMRSRKVRISARGKKYIIVPLSAKESSSPSIGMPATQEVERKVLSIIGTYREEKEDGTFVKRNRYASSTVKVSDKYTGGKNTVIFKQNNERGGSSSQTKTLVTVTSDSNWNPYPSIKPQKFVEKLQRVADAVMSDKTVIKNLTEALYADIMDYINKRKRKRKNG